MWFIYFRSFNVIVHSSSTSEDFQDNKNICDLKLRYGGCLEIVLEPLINFAKDYG